MSMECEKEEKKIENDVLKLFLFIFDTSLFFKEKGKEKEKKNAIYCYSLVNRDH
jgi:hypothetical protein